MKYSILILGGTTEARALAGRLAQSNDFNILLSLAGRTKNPVEQPVPVRTGGFGGAAGLGRFLRENRVDVLIDATHPFAAKISGNAAIAAAATATPIFALRRPAWSRQPGDRWREVADIAAAVGALDIPMRRPMRRIFLTLGRQELLPFEAIKQHHYLVRSVDPVTPPLDLPQVAYITARGPFSERDEIELLKSHAIDIVVSKNSGGAASIGKIGAARHLGLEVIIIEPPRLPSVTAAPDVDGIVDMLHHWTLSRMKRGE